MRMTFSGVWSGILLLGLSAGLSGCYVYPAGYPAGGDPYAPYYTGGAVAAAPPAPVVETYGVPPVAGYVWIGGYWNWAGGRYAWVGGHWSAPRAGFRWVPHSWVHGAGGWRLARGHWARR
jgi:hypothetical protein